MKKALILAAMLALAAPASARDWWLGKNLGRPCPWTGEVATPTWSLCASGPPLEISLTYTPANGSPVVNPVRSAVSRWAAPQTCVGGQCGK